VFVYIRSDIVLYMLFDIIIISIQELLVPG